MRNLLGGLAAVGAMLVTSVASAAGVFTTAPLINDSDSGISAAKTYHALANFGEPNAATVNGVAFPGFNGGATINGTNFSLEGALNDRNDDADGTPGGSSGGILDLLNEFAFGISDLDANTQTPSVSRLTLTNLSVGTAYRTTFYNAPFGSAGGRSTNITASDGGFVNFDENFSAPVTVPVTVATANVLRYDFVATSPMLTIDFDPVSDGDTYHHYAFSNEVVPEPASLGLLGLGAIGLLVRRRR